MPEPLTFRQLAIHVEIGEEAESYLLCDPTSREPNDEASVVNRDLAAVLALAGPLYKASLMWADADAVAQMGSDTSLSDADFEARCTQIFDRWAADLGDWQDGDGLDFALDRAARALRDAALADIAAPELL